MKRVESVIIACFIRILFEIAGNREVYAKIDQIHVRLISRSTLNVRTFGFRGGGNTEKASLYRELLKPALRLAETTATR